MAWSPLSKKTMRWKIGKAGMKDPAGVKIVAGPRRSGRTTELINWVLQRTPHKRVIVVLNRQRVGQIFDLARSSPEFYGPLTVITVSDLPHWIHGRGPVELAFDDAEEMLAFPLSVHLSNVACLSFNSQERYRATRCVERQC